MIKNCEKCETEFEARPADVNRGRARFCSVSCASARKKQNLTAPRVTLKCAYCDCDFERLESNLSRSKHGIYFCCREHKDLGQRIGGIADIMPSHYGTGASRYRQIAFESLPAECNSCGYNTYNEVLVVHHKDRDRSNASLDNLEILCPTCHVEKHHLGL